ncbi:hypothetical protein ACPCUV_16835 [Streptomyces platensis]|uniref:hypothetical protein n=1 Tax=Streptomyces platensis TaxID=58346 RepID=UPI003C2CB90E
MAYESSVPYRAGTEGYTSFRIPAVVRARSGILLAFAEGRVTSAADSGTLHLVLERSADGGRTWGPSRPSPATAPNPATTAATPSARALMTLRTRHDGGLTWRPARPVTRLPAASCDLVRLDRDSVGLRHEMGDLSAYSTITFRRIPVEEPT